MTRDEAEKNVRDVIAVNIQDGKRPAWICLDIDVVDALVGAQSRAAIRDQIAGRVLASIVQITYAEPLSRRKLDADADRPDHRHLRARGLRVCGCDAARA